jgi:hypothetical protein
MRDVGSRIPDFGGNYLQSGCSVIHFYYSAAERMRFAAFLAEGLLLRQAAVIAGSQNFLDQVLDRVKPADGRRRIGAIESLVLQRPVADGVASLTRAVQKTASSGLVRVLADFSSLATNVFEIEAALSSAFAGLKLMKVTQYDGASIPAPVAVEQFKTHSLTVVGDAFYYENRDYVSPEAYFRKRAAGAGR